MMMQSNAGRADDSPAPSAPLVLRSFAPHASLDSTVRTRLPARPVLGLPLARLIPQDLHSALDYLHSAALFASGVAARSPAAKAVGFALGVGGVGVAAYTDARLGLVRALPIETHEVIDHLWGLAAVAAPFAFGYWRREPRVAALHVAVGIGHIVASLLTDYRAERALGRVPRAPRRMP